MEIAMKKTVFMMALVALVATAHAQRVEIGKRGDGKTGISFAGFKVGTDTASRTFLQTLQADLVRSGWFRISSHASLRATT